jgi:hypothetical protein
MARTLRVLLACLDQLTQRDAIKAGQAFGAILWFSPIICLPVPALGAWFGADAELFSKCARATIAMSVDRSPEVIEEGLHARRNRLAMAPAATAQIRCRARDLISDPLVGHDVIYEADGVPVRRPAEL